MNCPACRAGFRGATVCPRCGADLAPLMALVARAYGLRQEARAALEAGDFAEAHRLAWEAQILHATPSGRGLQVLAAWGRL